jgi:hypothetical protein
MIIKELDPMILEDKFAKAGRSAEEQMAYYLRRAFANDKNILVFNGLRLTKDEDAAQIDHLILHKYGVIVVESKSVTTQVQVNQHGEWSRWFNGTQKGMPSPIQQARRQGEFLKRYLNHHSDILLGKILGFQSHFRGMPIDVLVAISDSGIINRPKNLSLEEVCKADQATDKICAIFAKSSKANSFLNFNLKEGGYSFTEEELSKITAFLLRYHQPAGVKTLETTASEPLPKKIVKPKLEPQLPEAASAQPIKKQVCRHCRSSNLSVAYGKYGYYFKCSQCDGNTRINAICSSCSDKQKVRKSGNQFYAECDRCGTSNLFYKNSGAS